MRHLLNQVAIDGAIRQIARAILRTREAAGWTQAELADRARLSPDYLGKIERGQSCSIKALVQIAHALAISPWELMQGADGPPTVRETPQHPIELRRMFDRLARLPAKRRHVVDGLLRVLEDDGSAQAG